MISIARTYLTKTIKRIIPMHDSNGSIIMSLVSSNKHTIKLIVFIKSTSNCNLFFSLSVSICTKIFCNKRLLDNNNGNSNNNINNPNNDNYNKSDNDADVVVTTVGTHLTMIYIKLIRQNA